MVQPASLADLGAARRTARFFRQKTQYLSIDQMDLDLGRIADRLRDDHFLSQFFDYRRSDRPWIDWDRRI